MTRHRIGSVDDVAPGEIARVEVGEQAFCMAHVQGEGFFAVEDQCTHDDEELSEGELDGIELECPAHGSRFDLRTGAVRGLPARTAVLTYAVEVEGTDLFIVLEDALEVR